MHRIESADAVEMSRKQYEAACHGKRRRDYGQLLKRVQGHRCADTGGRLWKTAEVDHRVPLFRVWREHRQTAWPALLNFWGLPNLQVINRDAHRVKCAAEARSRGQNAAQVSPVRSATDLDGRATRPT